MDAKKRAFVCWLLAGAFCVGVVAYPFALGPLTYFRMYLLGRGFEDDSLMQKVLDCPNSPMIWVLTRFDDDQIPRLYIQYIRWWEQRGAAFIPLEHP